MLDRLYQQVLIARKSNSCSKAEERIDFLGIELLTVPIEVVFDTIDKGLL